MMLSIRPLSEAGGVEIRGADIARKLAPAERAEFMQLFNEHGLLLFRDQPMTKAALVEATRIFGVPDLHVLEHIRDAEAPEVTVLSTHGPRGDFIPDDEEEVLGKIDWHADQVYVTNPNRGGVMYPVEIPPEGGMTGFIDTARAYDSLPEETKKRIEGLSIIQSWRYAQEGIAKDPSYRTDEGAKMLELDLYPDLSFALVRSHPVTGRKLLFTPPMWSSGIVEMPGAHGRALIDELVQHAVRPEYMYWHSYRPGDVVVWDNWRMLHAASGTKGKYRRTMYRTVIKGGLEMGVPLDAVEKKAADKSYARATASRISEGVSQHG